jgi:hypothetical protein
VYKNLCVAAILLAIIVFTSGNKPADASAVGLPSPVIVAKVALTGQTAEIPTTTLFTPKDAGVYRISAYLSMTTRGNDGNYLNLNVGWTDDGGPEGPLQMLNVSDAQTTPSAYAFGPSSNLEQTLIVRAVAGAPVTYIVTADGQPISGAYELFLIAERLE